ncbi:UNVERIFIED_CONTAM: hypothetical protein Slati_3090100, partial [Sesamum latifolium]
PIPNSFFQTVTLPPSGLHGGLLNPGMVKYPFTPTIESGQKTCLTTMRTSLMPPRSTSLYTHLFSRTSTTNISFKPFLSCGVPLRTLYIPPLEKYPSLCGHSWTLRLACTWRIFYDVVPSSKDLLGDETWTSPLCSTSPTFFSEESSRVQTFRNPSGDVDASNLPRTKDHDEPFTILQIPENIQDETYVAAFLSCWLCNFVLPHNKVGKVRASTFKVASRMAHDECFSLVISVLASIYRGLRDMSTSMNLFESSAIFPIHYVYGWIGRYLQTHFPPKLEPIGAQMVKYAVENMARHFQPTEARNLFHRINPSRLLNFYFHHQGPSLVADDAKISNTFKHLFVALRSSYLTLRLGVESIVEAYSPHHFSRQFGFCQDVPGSLKKEILTCSLKELGRPWQSCTLSGTSSKLFIPGSVSSSPLVTKEYADWSKCNTNSLEKSTRVILKLNHPPDLEKGSKDNQVMPATETDAAKPVATTSKRRHNVLVDTPVAPLSSENDVISALSISNGQLSNPQPLEKLAGLEEGVPVTPEGSIGSVNGISASDFPIVDAGLNGELHPVSIDDHLSVETPSKPPKIVLPAIMEKPLYWRMFWRSRRRLLRLHLGHILPPKLMISALNL